MYEFAFPATLTSSNGRTVVTAFREDSDTPVYTADNSHPNWQPIIEGLIDGDDNVWSLFDVATGVMAKFNQVTDRVSWNGSEVLFDGDPVHSVLTQQLSRAIQDGDANNFTALAKFWEKLESNPNEHSRQQTYEFLATHEFQITPEGDVVGYKGVQTGQHSTDGAEVYYSSWASQVEGLPSAYVNGKPIKPMSKVPQSIGDVVTMPRSEVVHDPDKACERGLHVSTRRYAASYGKVMEVHFNPRDVVSVPNDASGEKVRVCRYKVARVAVENSGNSPVLRSDTPIYDTVGYAGI